MTFQHLFNGACALFLLAFVLTSPNRLSPRWVRRMLDTKGRTPELWREPARTLPRKPRVRIL